MLRKRLNLLLLLGLAVAMQSCIAYRFVGHGAEGIDDFKTFPTDTIRPATEPFEFVVAESSLLDTLRIRAYNHTPMTLSQMIDTLDGKNSSAGVVVVRRDTLLFEHYRGDVGADKHSTIFSISKSITSTLVGMAIDRGFIRSVDDPVTEYLPELKKKAEEFQRLTIAHLLDMRSGLAFSENYSPNPLSAMARLHYGRNIMGKIRRQKFKEEPGTRFEYSSMATAVLGAVLERATGCRYADLVSEWLWQPLGMERYALVNLDDYTHRMAKAYGGISTNPRDLARWGRLYLTGGQMESRQLLPKAWIDRSLSAERAIANGGFYTNSWRTVTVGVKWDERREFTTEELSDVMLRIHEQEGVAFDRIVATQDKKGLWTLRIVTDTYYALGVFGQVVFLDPQKGLVAVFLGNDRIDSYVDLFYKMSQYL